MYPDDLQIKREAKSVASVGCLFAIGAFLAQLLFYGVLIGGTIWAVGKFIMPHFSEAPAAVEEAQDAAEDTY